MGSPNSRALISRYAKPCVPGKECPFVCGDLEVSAEHRLSVGPTSGSIGYTHCPESNLNALAKWYGGVTADLTENVFGVVEVL